MFRAFIVVMSLVGLLFVSHFAGDRAVFAAQAATYPIVDTGQTACYDANGAEITCPAGGEAFYGQDAQVAGNTPAYTGHGDGTVTDNVTGLMWQQSPDADGDGDIDAADKLTYATAETYCETLTLAGHACIGVATSTATPVFIMPLRYPSGLVGIWYINQKEE